MSSEPALQAGHVIAGKYRLLAQLGRGGMGEVWRAQHLTLDTEVAVKVIHSRVLHNAEAVARFTQEARASAALKSTHVTQTLDAGVDGQLPYIVMEYLQGQPLSDLLASSGGRLDPALVADIVSQTAVGIEEAHSRGIVHRDLKPDNLFVATQDGRRIVKILDFGIAKIRGPGVEAVTAETRTGAVLGTPFYMSPEQARGNRALDGRSDLWSLAIIAFECLTGQKPFVGEVLGDLLMKICAEPVPVPSSVASVPAGFDAWFAHATQRDPDGRFQSARELSHALYGALGLAPPSGPISALASMPGSVRVPPQSAPATQSSVAPAAAPTGFATQPAGSPGGAVSAATAPIGTAPFGTVPVGTLAPTEVISPPANRPSKSMAVPIVLGMGALLVVAVAVVGGGLFFLSDTEPSSASSAPSVAEDPTADGVVADTPPSDPQPSDAPPSPTTVSTGAGTTGAAKPAKPTSTAQPGKTAADKQVADANRKVADANKKVEDANKKVEDANRKAAEAERKLKNLDNLIPK